MVCGSSLLFSLDRILTSTEPGYYEDGKFGIRIESMLFSPNLVASIIIE